MTDTPKTEEARERAIAQQPDTSTPERDLHADSVERAAIVAFLLACAEEADRQKGLFAGHDASICNACYREAKAYRAAARMIGDRDHDGGPTFTAGERVEIPKDMQARAVERGHVNIHDEAMEMFAHLNCPACGGSGHIDDAASPAPNDDLRAALEPFGRYASALLSRRDGAEHEAAPDDKLVFGIDGQHITIGNLRHAAALTREGPSS